MASAVSKAEYLKRYLSGGIQEDKKKKKKKKLNKLLAEKSRVKIIDDDIDLKSLLPENLGNTLEEDVGDNEPTVAEIVDERPEHIKHMEQYRLDTRWKVLGQDAHNEHPEKYGAVTESKHDSPSRFNRHDSDSDQSPLRTQRHDSDSDQSPVRDKRKNSDSDQSPIRTQRHDSDSDQSPIRTKRHDSDSDQSPVRTKRKNSDSDQSPVRKNIHHSDTDQSPIRKNRQGSDSDQSPVRKNRHHSDSDQSPPRRKVTDSDQSPPRKRNRANDRDKSDPSDRRKNTDSKPEKTLAGAKAGLSSAKDVRREAEFLKKKFDTAFGKIDESLLGKNAQTVFRDRKTGKRRNLKEEKEKADEDNQKKKEEEEKYKKWGKGLKQQAAQDVALSETLHEFSKPLARYRDDEDLDDMLKHQDREGDPMLAFITKKHTDKKKKEKPQYKGPYPPNRFGLRPGYRWDGVDRSSGFEKQYFAKMADRQATNEMAYKWSIEDM